MIRYRQTYRSCSDLPLSNFIKIVFNDEMALLYTEPKTLLNKNVDLEAVWSEIFQEYNTISKNTRSSHILSLLKTITTINIKLDLIKNICAFLLIELNPDLVKILKEMGFNYKYSSETIEKDVEMTLISSNRFVVKLDEANAQYDAIIAQDNESQVKESDFYNLVAQVSKYMGFKIDTRLTSVMEWCNYIEAFTSEQKKNGERTKNR